MFNKSHFFCRETYGTFKSILNEVITSKLLPAENPDKKQVLKAEEYLNGIIDLYEATPDTKENAIKIV